MRSAGISIMRRKFCSMSSQSEREIHILLDFMFGFCIFGALLCGTDGKIDDINSSPGLHLSPASLKSFLTRMMQQNPSMRDCPAPNFPLEKNDCSLPKCINDSSCSNKNQSCCFNGCIFTCLEKLAPPPVIDWEDEPDASPIRKDGDEVLRCTTSPRPAPSEVLSCPKHYVCRIDDYGDYVGNLPLGICVPEAPDELDPEVENASGLKEKTRKQTVYLPGGCVLSEAQYKYMQDFKKRSYVIDCFCVHGSIECQLFPEKQ